MSIDGGVIFINQNINVYRLFIELFNSIKKEDKWYEKNFAFAA